MGDYRDRPERQRTLAAWAAYLAAKPAASGQRPQRQPSLAARESQPNPVCDIGGTNSFDCPLPALVGKCSANLECVPNGPNNWCRKLKRLKQAKKHVKKREGNEGKWEVKCSQEK